MPFTFQCPYCRIELEAQDEWENLETTCPQCGQTILIRNPLSSEPMSAPESAPASEAEPPRAETFLFLCPECGQLAELGAEQNGRSIECPNCAETVTAVPASERPCPFCGEKIKLRAKICKHCGKAVPLFPPVSGAPDGTPQPEPDGKYCPHCGQIIKKQAVFCKFCRKELSGQQTASEPLFAPTGETVVEKLFHRFALAAAPVFIKDELHCGGEDKSFIGPLTKVMLVLLGLLLLAGCIGNIVGMWMIGKYFQQIIPGARLIFSALAFLAVAGSVHAYRREEVFTPVLTVCMWILPVAAVLAQLLPGEAGLAAAALSVPGSTMVSYTSLAMIWSMLCGKVSRFDRLNQTAFLAQAVGSILAALVLIASGAEDWSVVVLGLVLVVLLLCAMTRLYLLAFLMSDRKSGRKRPRADFSENSPSAGRSRRNMVVCGALLGGGLVLLLLCIAVRSKSGGDVSGDGGVSGPDEEAVAAAGERERQYFYDLGRSRAARWSGGDNYSRTVGFMEELKKIPVSPEVDPYAEAKKEAWVRGWNDFMSGRGR